LRFAVDEDFGLALLEIELEPELDLEVDLEVELEL
jgi:hypothetical protein